jgi:hypothetical protein
MPPIRLSDLAQPRFKANPFPFYARMRAEAPAFEVTGPFFRRAWLVTRYDDVVALLKKEYSLTKEGRAVLDLLEEKVDELHREGGARRGGAFTTAKAAPTPGGSPRAMTRPSPPGRRRRWRHPCSCPGSWRRAPPAPSS